MTEFHLEERDIVCDEPASDARAHLRVDYADPDAFVADYLGMRRGEPFIVDAPANVATGDLVDLDFSVDGAAVMLHGQVLSRWPLEGGDKAQIHVITGRFTDRIVRGAVAGLKKLPLIARLLGIR